MLPSFNQYAGECRTAAASFIMSNFIFSAGLKVKHNAFDAQELAYFL